MLVISKRGGTLIRLSKVRGGGVSVPPPLFRAKLRCIELMYSIDLGLHLR